LVYVNRLGGLLARNQTQQDTLHRVKLGGVDERIDAVVEIRDAHQSVVAECTNLKLNVGVDKKEVNERRCPGDCE